MPGKIPPLLGLALGNLLLAHGLTGKQLADAAGISRSTVSAYLNGDVELSRDRLVGLADRVGLGLVEVEKAIHAARLTHPETPAPSSPVDPTAEEWRILDVAVAFGLGEVAEHLRSRILRIFRETHWRQAREEAERLLQQLKRHTRAARRVLVDGAPEFQAWAVCVRLCDESEKRAPHSAREALGWAVLACRAARHAPGGDAFRTRLLGFALAFVANALRVQGRFLRSEKVFAAARRLWDLGADEAGLLDEGRVLDMEASLRRDQRRFDQALQLNAQAAETAYPDRLCFIYLNRAYTLEEQGNHEAAIEALELLTPLIDGRRQARLLFGMLFNWAGCLCRMGRAKEAVPLVQDVREMAVALRNDSDLTRVLWLESQVLEGLGRREEAVAALEQVRRDFAARGMPYDFGLAGIDLALLYRRQDRWAEIQDLAAEMVRIFQAAGVHRESLAAVSLLREAAVRREVTADLLKGLREYLKKARANPRFRFTPCEG